MKKSYEFLFSAFCVLLNFGCARTPALSPAISPGKTGTVVFKPPGYLRGDRNTHAKRVIIFIHGVFGDGTSTWQNHASGAYFPALVAADETFAGADIWVHQFDTPKLRQSYTIDELADHLRRYLNNDNVVANHDEIIFVAHSMGGLVARAYLLKYREMPPERVRMMYFFSTPTTGSDVASLARLISDNPQLSDMRKMTTDDAGVLGVWEAQWSSSPYAKTTLSYCAYELLPTMGTIVVQRESARHLCNTRPDPIARNHIDIVKPRDGDDESYVAFRQAYRDTFEQHASTPVWNLLRQDRSLLQVRNVTQTPYCEYSCWSDAVIVAPGDVVRFAAYYHNVGIVTAKDARLSIRVPQVPVQFLPITATLSSTNVQPAFGQVFLSALTPVLLVPTDAWTYNDDPENVQPLLFGQQGHQAATGDGLRLGDVGSFADARRVVIEFRCEPVTAVVRESDEFEKQLGTMLQQLKAGPSDEDLFQLLTTTLSGHAEVDISQHHSWISDVYDIHDDGSLVLVLSQFNNTPDFLRDVRARVWVVPTGDVTSDLYISLRSAGGEIRTETAHLHLRPGTTHRPALQSATHGPKTLLQQMELYSSLRAGTVDEEALASDFPLNTSNDEVMLGDLPPQAAVAAFFDFQMVPADRPHRRSEPTAFPATRTTLNGEADHAFLQVANDRNTRAWRPQIAGFRPDGPLGFAVYFKNSGKAIAQDVRIRLALSSDEQGIAAHGTMTAANANSVGGDARVTFDRPTPGVRVYYDRGDVYRVSSNAGRLIDATKIQDGIPIGDLDPGEWGWLKVTYATSAVARDSSSGECLFGAAIADERIERTISFENSTHMPVADVKLRVHLDYQPQMIRTSIVLTANGKELARRTTHAATAGKPVLLRYGDAQVYTSLTPRHIDARKATESEISLGNIPADQALFIRLIYDVVAAPEPKRCGGGCRLCAEKEPCPF